MNTPQEKLVLLQQTVAAKMQYWDALHKLETALVSDGFSDKANDSVIDEISSFAAGLDSTDQVNMITLDHLARIEKFAQLD
ncbi:MAG: hypothetical protein Q7S87_01080 [Agitococcus sp.]|nr:hypothetical protein [Agitococcus sp.]MDO9179120.1 hypothetical protein [Agitococcus sp.]